MEKKVLKGKKEIRSLIIDSLHKVVQSLGITKSRKKTERVINKSAKRIAELVADQVKKEVNKIKEAKEKKAKKPKAAKAKKMKKAVEPELETA